MSWYLILFTSVNNERVFDSMENFVSFFYCLSNSCCFESIDKKSTKHVVVWAETNLTKL